MNPEFWKGRRVLVTGHTGFKGSWLCIWLHAVGARVAGYALTPPTDPSLYELAGVDDLVESTIADVRDLDRLQRAIRDFEPDTVIHMAAQSVVLTSYEDPSETYATNVVGTVHVLEAIRRAGRPCVVVNVTTDKCYENRGWVWGYRETDTLGGHDPYSNSKACAELVAQSFRSSFFPLESLDRHGVALASARAGNVIGGGDWTAHQLVPEATSAFAKSKPVVLRNPDATRPWQHVLDCLNGYLVLAEHLATAPADASGEWNFGPSTERAVPVRRIVEMLGACWKLDDCWTQADNSAASHEAHELTLDATKAHRLLNWQCRLRIEEAVEWVAEWYIGFGKDTDPRQLCLSQIERFQALRST